MNPTTYETLAADPAIAALVGDKIYPGMAPQDTPPPYVVFLPVSMETLQFFADRSDLDYDRVQVHAWATDRKTAMQIALACRAALDGAGYMVGGYIDDFELETRLNRVGFDWGMWNPR